MPGIEDWVNGPMSIIQSMFDRKQDGHYEQVKEYFLKKFEDNSTVTWVPSLNSTPLHNLCNNSLVRFRCMIQDTYDPEFYLGLYEVQDVKSGQTHLQSGMFKDIAECKSHEEIKLDSTRNVTLDRQMLYCVPIPAECEWVKQAYAGIRQHSSASGSSVNRCKRPLEDENEVKDKCMNGDATPMEIAAGADDTKKIRTEANQNSQTNKPPNLNFPLPNEKGPACLVKVYDNVQTFKVNDVVEFIGILSTDPAMASFKDEQSLQCAFADANDAVMNTEEENAHSPPPSLVPRLHVIIANKMQHNNPLLPADPHGQSDKDEINNLMKDVSSLRQDLLSLLEQVVFGDKLAAEYLLCHLVSSVYARQDVMALGKFALNLSGLPRNSDSACRIYKIIEQLLTKSHLLSMSLENMNTLKFVPQKDYSANRLLSGVLQLSERTHLVMDETAMQSGQLDANGVRNLTALGNVINWQKVEYNFQFHTQDFNCNIVCLVLSEGKSLMKCDSRVHLRPQQNPDNLDSYFKVIEDKLTSGILTKLRMFIGLVQMLPYDLSDHLRKDIESDFVTIRKNDPNKMSVEDLSNLLILARLLSISHGQSQLTKELWEKTKLMESQRKHRLTTQ